MILKRSKKSSAEESLVLQLRVHKITRYVREHRFHPKRQWRFDFADTERLIAIEIDGGIFGRKSGHNTGVGILRKMEKLNEAQLLGWKVFSFSADQVRNGDVLRFIQSLEGKGLPITTEKHKATVT